MINMLILCLLSIWMKFKLVLNNFRMGYKYVLKGF